MSRPMLGVVSNNMACEFMQPPITQPVIGLGPSLPMLVSMDHSQLHLHILMEMSVISHCMMKLGYKVHRDGVGEQNQVIGNS